MMMNAVLILFDVRKVHFAGVTLEISQEGTFEGPIVKCESSPPVVIHYRLRFHLTPGCVTNRRARTSSAVPAF